MSVTSIEWADRVWNPVSGCTKVSQGCCVEDQATADQRIPILLQTPAAVRWVSAEPLLEQVDLGAFLCGKREAGRDLAGTGATIRTPGPSHESLPTPLSAPGSLGSWSAASPDREGR